MDAASLSLNGVNQIQRAALSGDVTASAGSNATRIVQITDGGGTIWFVQGSSLGAPSWSQGQLLGTAIGSNGIQSYEAPESLAWGFAGAASMGYQNSTLIVPYNAPSGNILSATAGTSIFTTLAAQWGSANAGPFYHLQAHARARLYVNVGNLIVSGTGSVNVQFAVVAVNGSPGSASNYVAVLNVITGATSGGQFQLSANASALPAGEYALVAYRTDTNDLATVAALQFSATLVVL